jgi:hypothetical protein
VRDRMSLSWISTTNFSFLKPLHDLFDRTSRASGETSLGGVSAPEVRFSQRESWAMRAPFARRLIEASTLPRTCRRARGRRHGICRCCQPPNAN